ncbi:uncharacterized protein LOC110718441 [Chenopodium quinoa]|uniref:uncharacterized protein LOC110718441 n=1 Tax=Chenopodium quinoa TaxID=63459 RepID=UPI000B77BEA4|nr:uncharacterized protein LOC110718441 [Chenopodium quinoa]
MILLSDKFLGSIGIFALGNKTTKSELCGDVDSKVNWYMKLKKDEHISKLTIKSGFVVDGFVFEVKNKTTGNSYSQKFSGPGENEDLITLEDDEVITQIDGVYGDYNKEGIKIALIKIYTNLHPEGMEYGNLDDVTNTENFSYTVPSMNSSIVGFYGSYGLLLNSFGIIDETKEFHKYGPYGRPTFA